MFHVKFKPRHVQLPSQLHNTQFRCHQVLQIKAWQVTSQKVILLNLCLVQDQTLNFIYSCCPADCGWKLFNLSLTANPKLQLQTGQKLRQSFMNAPSCRWKAILGSMFCNLMRGNTAYSMSSLELRTASLTGKYLFCTIPEWWAMNVPYAAEQNWVQLPF